MRNLTRLILLAMMTLTTIPAFSQIRFGIKGGVNISKVHFNGDIIKANNITGFQVGPMMEVMAPYTGLGVDASILYSQKGMEIGEDSYTTDYLDVPLNFKWKFGLPILKGYLAAGPYFGFRVGGDKIWNVVNSQIKAKTFNTGLNIGAGVEAIRHLQLGINYAFGLTDNYDSNIVEVGQGKNRTWSITAAILF